MTSEMKFRKQVPLARLAVDAGFLLAQPVDDIMDDVGIADDKVPALGVHQRLDGFLFQSCISQMRRVLALVPEIMRDQRHRRGQIAGRKVRVVNQPVV